MVNSHLPIAAILLRANQRAWGHFGASFLQQVSARCRWRQANSGVSRILGLSPPHSRGAARARQGKAREDRIMAARGLIFLCLGLLVGGCMQSTLEVASDASMT